jgi:hypothetical protein
VAERELCKLALQVGVASNCTVLGNHKQLLIFGPAQSPDCLALVILYTISNSTLPHHQRRGGTEIFRINLPAEL